MGGVRAARAGNNPQRTEEDVSQPKEDRAAGEAVRRQEQAAVQGRHTGRVHTKLCLDTICGKSEKRGRKWMYRVRWTTTGAEGLNDESSLKVVEAVGGASAVGPEPIAACFSRTAQLPRPLSGHLARLPPNCYLAPHFGSGYFRPDLDRR